jgi:hypothetical protein
MTVVASNTYSHTHQTSGKLSFRFVPKLERDEVVEEEEAVVLKVSIEAATKAPGLAAWHSLSSSLQKHGQIHPSQSFASMQPSQQG